MIRFNFGFHLGIAGSHVGFSIYPFAWMLAVQNGSGFTNLLFGPFRLMLQPQVWPDKPATAKPPNAA